MHRSRSPTAVAAALMLMTVGVSCRDAPPPPVLGLTLATGSAAGVYFPLGTSLARIYTERLAGVHVRAVETGASPANVDALEAGTADMAFTLGDVAYYAYTEGTRLQEAPHRRLRSIAMLYPNALHFFVAASSRLHSVRDLAGTRLAVGVANVVPGRSRSVELLIRAHGVAASTVAMKNATFGDIVTGVRDGSLDVGVISAGYPVAAIETAARAGLRFLEIDADALERVRENYPFFLPLAIPPDTYAGQREPIETVGVDNVLLCRADLDEALVYRLTRAFFEALPELAATHPSARRIDADLAPASAIPLHPGAARYYRERELLLY